MWRDTCRLCHVRVVSRWNYILEGVCSVHPVCKNPHTTVGDVTQREFMSEIWNTALVEVVEELWELLVTIWSLIIQICQFYLETAEFHEYECWLGNQASDYFSWGILARFHYYVIHEIKFLSVTKLLCFLPDVGKKLVKNFFCRVFLFTVTIWLVKWISVRSFWVTKSHSAMQNSQKLFHFLICFLEES